MVSMQSVEEQLKKLKFNMHAWGRAEVRELPHILMPGEQIHECVNGMYEGGFALLVATESRVLLIDKKPLNYLTVEDLLFDMINELDYSHRMIGAQINISAGSKNLKFKSYNQPRLRKLITHVQHEIAEGKKQQSVGQQDQKQHLEQINQQLQAYLIAQHQQQETLRLQLASAHASSSNTDIASLPEPAKPSPELSDFLFAQSLLKQYREQAAGGQSNPPLEAAVTADPSQAMLAAATPPPAAPVAAIAESAPVAAAMQAPESAHASPQLADLYAEGMKEIFGRQSEPAAAEPTPVPAVAAAVSLHNPLEINPLSIAYSKLPMALRNRKFGRPSFTPYSQNRTVPTVAPTPLPAS
jgi:hypothetical protein